MGNFKAQYPVSLAGFYKKCVHFAFGSNSQFWSCCKSLLGLAGWLLFSFSAAWVGSRHMPGEWYKTLLKPSWNPPNAIFAPVWSVLYMFMGVAAWLVWRQAGFKGAAAALSVFGVQLALNALWTYLFFGMRRPDLAFFEIIFLWALIVLVIVLFRRINRAAAFLMLPYVLWVSFAAYLNFVIWRLNPGR